MKRVRGGFRWAGDRRAWWSLGERLHADRSLFSPPEPAATAPAVHGLPAPGRRTEADSCP